MVLRVLRGNEQLRNALILKSAVESCGDLWSSQPAIRPIQSMMPTFKGHYLVTREEFYILKLKTLITNRIDTFDNGRLDPSRLGKGELLIY